ncbi:MAG: TolC family protein [Deltaproteobacteria bacterium]|nr:TolC family protein [Deltaproteobacteria bacterium]
MRHTIPKPFLENPPAPETIFGEATLGSSASPAAINTIQAPPLPHTGSLSLDDCLTLALKVSPTLDSAQQQQLSAMWSEWQAKTAFLPTGTMSYGYTRYDHDQITSLTLGHQQFTWQTQITQPLFTGGRTLANYLLSQLGVEAATIQTTQTRENLLLAVKQAYFSILATEKALAVAKASVVNLSSHLSVAQNFFDVGMVPRNQVLEAEVELANAQQEETNQTRNLVVNIARLNILLRQPLETSLKIQDNLRYSVFPLTLDRCLELGLSNNPEILLGKNQVEAGAKNVDLARADLYPQISLAYTLASTGNTAKAYGGWQQNSSSWNIAAVASINFWEWGRTLANIEKNKILLNQAIDSLTSLEDNLKLEITSNYQSLLSAGRNIDTSAKAVVAAAENLRMATERYQEQVATNTEVLDAQTRYSQAQYEHFAALYNYNLAWAALERSLGQRVIALGSAPRA